MTNNETISYTMQKIMQKNKGLYSYTILSYYMCLLIATITIINTKCKIIINFIDSAVCV